MNLMQMAKNALGAMTSGKGVMKMSAEQHERHTNIQRGIALGNGVYGDILEDLSPNDTDSPGVLTFEEAGVRIAERLGARTAGNS